MGIVRRRGALMCAYRACSGVAAPGVAWAHDDSIAIGPPLPPLPVSDDPAQSGRFGKPFSEPTDQRPGREHEVHHRRRRRDPLQARRRLAGDHARRADPLLERARGHRAGEALDRRRGREHRDPQRPDPRPDPARQGPPAALGAADARSTAAPTPAATTTTRSSPAATARPNNDGALFCSDLVFLPDGRVLATGGTSYYLDPEVADSGLGVSSSRGWRTRRIFDPKTNTWTQSGSMQIGRWYPSMVTLADGDLFVASGVTEAAQAGLPGAARSARGPTSPRPRPTTPRPAPGPTTAPPRSARCRSTPGCTCSRTARSTTTPAGSRSTRSASRTTWRSGTSPPPTTRGRRPGPTSGSPASAASTRRPAASRRSSTRSPTCGARRPGPRPGRDDPRVPGLDLLDDAAAGARRGRRLHEGELPDRRRRARLPGRQPGQLRRHLRQPDHHRRPAERRQRSRPSRPATSRGRAGIRPASCCRPAR